MALIQNAALINPAKGKKSPITGSIAIMAATDPDIQTIINYSNANKSKRINTLMTGIYEAQHNDFKITIAGPFIGAPHAGMILENLIAWGVKKVILIGWCGSISKNVKTGDIIIPSAAFSDEGTSIHYGLKKQPVTPSKELTSNLMSQFENKELSVYCEPVWTTDAIYRETKEKIKHYQKLGAFGVEMESSALFSIAKFRNVDVSSVLIVSDELYTLEWQSGFGNKKFKKKRKKVIELICKYLRGLNE